MKNSLIFCFSKINRKNYVIFKKSDKTGVSRKMLSYYRKQEPMLNQQTQENLRHKNYSLQPEYNQRVTGLFPIQQNKLAAHIRKRRDQAKAISTIYIRRKMKQFCLKDKPANFDPEKYIFCEHWVTNFMDKHHFSVR